MIGDATDDKNIFDTAVQAKSIYLRTRVTTSPPLYFYLHKTFK
jgi:hypothetical protein